MARPRNLDHHVYTGSIHRAVKNSAFFSEFNDDIYNDAFLIIPVMSERAVNIRTLQK